MPFAVVLAAAAALSPLFTSLDGGGAVAVTPARPAALAVRWSGRPVTARVTSVAIHDCGRSPWLYGVTATADDRCTRLAAVAVTVDGAAVIVPTQAFAGLGNVMRAALKPTRTGVDLYLRGAEGGAEDYGVTLSFDRHGLVARRVYWPDGTAETTTYTPAA